VSIKSCIYSTNCVCNISHTAVTTSTSSLPRVFISASSQLSEKHTAQPHEGVFCDSDKAPLTVEVTLFFPYTRTHMTSICSVSIWRAGALLPSSYVRYIPRCSLAICIRRGSQPLLHYLAPYIRTARQPAPFSTTSLDISTRCGIHPRYLQNDLARYIHKSRQPAPSCTTSLASSILSSCQPYSLYAYDAAAS